MKSHTNLTLENHSRDTLIKNSFYLWTNGLILLLTAIPVGSYLMAQLLNTVSWTVPKIYELKMYALAMLICMLIPFSGLHLTKSIQKNYPRYQSYMLLFYPISALIYALPLPQLLQYASIFLLALLGLGIFIFDNATQPNKTDSSKPSIDRFFLLSIGLSILLIVYTSDFLVFSFRTSWIPLLGIFTFCLLVLQFARIKSKYVLWLLPLFLFAVTFWSMDGIDISHYSFFLGPVIEATYGHSHPLLVDAQYGSGLTAFLVLYFKTKNAISFESLQMLAKALTFIQYTLIYFIAVSLYQSSRAAFLVLLAVIFFHFYSVNGWLYYMAPSISFLRFGFIYLVLTCYILEKNKLIHPTTMNVLTSILGSIACIWSFESAVYTLPALFFAEYISKNLKRFLPVFCIVFLISVSLYLLPFIAQGTWPPFSRYYEYALAYSNGFGQIPLNRSISFWWLLPLLYGFILIKILAGQISDKLVAALTIYGMAIFTYFGGRAHPAFLLVVSIPFILLTAYLILNLKQSSLFQKNVLLSLMLVIFFSTHNVLFPGVGIKILWERNVPLLKESFLSSINPNYPAQIITRLSKSNCSTYLPLQKYIEHNSIGILSLDYENLLNFYNCTHTHNALMINPYEETALNPVAVNRAVKKASNFANKYILVDTKLLDSKNSPMLIEVKLSEMTDRILKEIRAVKIDELVVGTTRMVVFQSNNMNSV